VSEQPGADREALDTARSLTGTLAGVRDELRAVNERQERAEKRQDRAERFSHRSWIVILITVVSLAIDLSLTGLFIANNVRLDHVTGQLKHTSASLSDLHGTEVSACQSGNVLRAQQKRALDAILSPGRAQPGETATQRRQAAQFLASARADVARGWGPRPCQKLYRIP
jgi:hypothetical protein